MFNKELKPILLKLVKRQNKKQTNKKGVWGALPNFFYEASNTLLTKTGKDTATNIPDEHR